MSITNFQQPPPLNIKINRSARMLKPCLFVGINCLSYRFNPVESQKYTPDTRHIGEDFAVEFTFQVNVDSFMKLT